MCRETGKENGNYRDYREYVYTYILWVWDLGRIWGPCAECALRGAQLCASNNRGGRGLLGRTTYGTLSGLRRFGLCHEKVESLLL